MAIDKSPYTAAAPRMTETGGLSQRDTVAIAAMKGFLAGMNQHQLFAELMQSGEAGLWPTIAEKSFKMADAMIEASKEK